MIINTKVYHSLLSHQLSFVIFVDILATGQPMITSLSYIFGSSLLLVEFTLDVTKFRGQFLVLSLQVLHLVHNHPLCTPTGGPLTPVFLWNRHWLFVEIPVYSIKIYSIPWGQITSVFKLSKGIQTFMIIYLSKNFSQRTYFFIHIVSINLKLVYVCY